MFSATSFAHEYYLSVTRGNYNAETQMMQCEMKVTAHDMENAIRVMYAQSFNLDDKNQVKKQNELLEKYLRAKINILINDKYIDFEYIGFELELTDDLWIYFQFRVPDLEFKYENKILTELFAMQQNVTHFKTADCERSFVFTKNHSPEKFTCNE
jgi:hypothetical protein